MTNRTELVWRRVWLGVWIGLILLGVTAALWGTLKGGLLAPAASASQGFTLFPPFIVDSLNLGITIVSSLAVLGVAMWSMRLVNREGTRRFALMLVTLASGEFFLLMLTVWGPSCEPITKWLPTDAAALLAFELPIVGVVAIGMAHAMQFPNWRFAAWVGLVFAIMTGAIVVTQAFLHLDPAINGVLWTVAWWGLALGVALFGCLAGQETNLKYVGWAGATAGVSGALLGLDWDYFSPTDASFVGHAAVALATAAVLAAHVNLLVRAKLPGTQRYVAWATLALALGAGVLFQFIPALGDYQDMSALPPQVWVTAELLLGAICGTTVAVILSRLNRRVGEVAPVLRFTEMAVVCPSCQKSQTVPVGPSICAECGTKFSISAEEPHCRKCDYLLVNINSDRCPECGEPIFLAV